MIELKGTYNQDCKIFIDEVETEAIELVRNILNQEISAGVQVRIMPDTHVGKGIVIGLSMVAHSVKGQGRWKQNGTVAKKTNIDRSTLLDQ